MHKKKETENIVQEEEEVFVENKDNLNRLKSFKPFFYSDIVLSSVTMPGCNIYSY